MVDVMPPVQESGGIKDDGEGLEGKTDDGEQML